MPAETPSFRPTTTITCTTHGLRFDPLLSRGCIRCRKSSAPPPPKRWPWVLLGVAIVAGATTGALVYERLHERASSPSSGAVDAQGGVAPVASLRASL
jgi:hypothetical protein